MHNIVASLLQRSSSALAAHSASLLLERHPESGAHFGPEAFRNWQAYLGVRIQELAVALEFEDPPLFESAMAWARESFAVRDVPTEDLRHALDCLHEVLVEELPPPTESSVAPHFDVARQQLVGAWEPMAALGANDELGRRALTYLEACLSGQPRVAIEGILDSVHDIDQARAVYVDLIPAAHREVGRLWHAAKLGVHEEHLVTTTTRTLMTLLSHRFAPPPSRDHRILSATIGEDAHDIGVQIVTDLFVLAGWPAICLGSRMPAADLARAVGGFHSNLVALSATLIPHLIELRSAIRMVRGVNPDVRVLVGGGALNATPKVWQSVGADGFTVSAAEVVSRAEQLLA